MRIITFSLVAPFCPSFNAVFHGGYQIYRDRELLDPPGIELNKFNFNSVQQPSKLCMILNLLPYLIFSVRRFKLFNKLLQVIH